MAAAATCQTHNTTTTCLPNTVLEFGCYTMAYTMASMLSIHTYKTRVTQPMHLALTLSPAPKLSHPHKECMASHNKLGIGHTHRHMHEMPTCSTTMWFRHNALAVNLTVDARRQQPSQMPQHSSSIHVPVACQTHITSGMFRTLNPPAHSLSIEKDNNISRLGCPSHWPPLPHMHHPPKPTTTSGKFGGCAV